MKRIIISLILLSSIFELHAQQYFKTVISLRYEVILPENYKDSIKKWPVIIYLHGTGGNGLDDYIRNNNFGRKKFILVAPITTDTEWEPVLLNYFYDDVITKFNINTDKIFLTGTSMGGIGVWDWVQSHPEKFTAIAPVCGAGQVRNAWKSRYVPTRIFHGESDEVISPDNSKEMAAELNKYSDCKITLYENLGHNISKEVYTGKDLYQWFLNQEIKIPEHSVNDSLLTEYSGKYRYPNGEVIEVTHSGDSLFVKIQGHQLYLTPENNSTFHIGEWYSNMGIFSEGKLQIYDDKNVSTLKRVK